MSTWSVTPKEDGLRLIYFLQSKSKTRYSARFWKRAVEKNLCKVNGKRERFGSKVLKEKDRVELEKNWAERMGEVPSLSCTILYEDEHLVIVDKPSGIVSDEDHFPSLFLTHRLDKETSGVFILAKNQVAKEAIMKLFKERAISKSYLALVEGSPKKDSGTIKSHLSRKSIYQGGTLWGSSPIGLEAITEWECLQRNPETSLILCKPKTGRMHQIRVHLKEMGCPILGDYQYNPSSKLSASRLHLHAWKIEFMHPFYSQPVSIEAPIPEIFSAEFLLTHSG